MRSLVLVVMLLLTVSPRPSDGHMPTLWANAVSKQDHWPLVWYDSYLLKWTEANDGKSVDVRQVHTYAKLSQREWYGVAVDESAHKLYVCEGGDNGNTQLCTLQATSLVTGLTHDMATPAFWQQGFVWDDDKRRLLTVIDDTKYNGARHSEGEDVPTLTFAAIDPATGTMTNLTTVTFPHASFVADLDVFALGLAQGQLHALIRLGQSGPFAYVVVDATTGTVISHTSPIPNFGLGSLYLDDAPAGPSFVGPMAESIGSGAPWAWARLGPGDKQLSVITPNITWPGVDGPATSTFDPDTHTFYAYSTYAAGGTVLAINGTTGVVEETLSMGILPKQAVAISLF